MTNVIDYNPGGTTTAGHITTGNTLTIGPGLPVAYKCPTCKKRYLRFASTFSCCVQHGPGDCCHFMEQRITKKGYPKENR